ncbi:MAG: hypothetical protein ACI7YS_02055 [Flavobacterium sp.]
MIFTFCERKDKVTKAKKSIRQETQKLAKSYPVSKIPPENTTSSSIPTIENKEKEKVKTTLKPIIKKGVEVSNVGTTTVDIKKEESNPKNYRIYGNLKKIIDFIPIGQTVSREELMAANIVPEDAAKLVKTITRISKDELEIKWKNTWMVEKISDVRFKDSRMKISFSKDLVYTSGDAIGIEYENKIHNNLTIKDDRAYIPNVKEYCWRIKQ